MNWELINMDCFIKCVKSCSFQYDYFGNVFNAYEGMVFKAVICDDGIRFMYKEEHLSLPHSPSRLKDFFVICSQNDK